MPIRYEASAELDLLDIIDFGIDHDLPDPVGFIAKLKKKIALLDTMPGMGRDRYEIGLLVFDLPGTSHFVAYRLNPPWVEVVRELPHRRQWP